MTSDLKAIMARDERRRRMLNDPDLTGELLLFALALDEVIVTRKEQGRRTLRNWVQEVAVLAHEETSYYLRYWGKSVLRDDFPRYEAPRPHGRTVCVAPMIRREGPCGKVASLSWIDSDPITGESMHVGLCARHRGGEVQAYYDRRHAEWVANGKPIPPANTGGVLRRYFSADWDSIYQWARPGSTPMEGGREATPPRPKLRLIPGG
jgi:hypothetical protein